MRRRSFLTSTFGGALLTSAARSATGKPSDSSVEAGSDDQTYPNREIKESLDPQRAAPQDAALPHVHVAQQQILYYSREYLRHSQWLQRKEQDTIVAWGWRILEWPPDSAKSREVFPEDPLYRFSNGSCAMDVNEDGDEELIVGTYKRENWRTHRISWYERVSGQVLWRQYLIGEITAPGMEMPHDIQPLSVRLPGGENFQGIVLTIGRVDMYLFEKPADPTQPWARYTIGHLPNPPQSGMQVADVNGDGRPDVVTGMFWVECPPDPRTGVWRFHRYGDLDLKHKYWGGMNKHAVADFDGDGITEIVADEAENADSMVVFFKPKSGDVDALWQATLVDRGLYCPHSMAVADFQGGGLPDIIVGEMDAGGWEFPMTPSPKIYAYLNQGNGRFRRVTLAEGYGVHEGKMAPRLYRGRSLFYGNNTIQPWLDGMVTNLSTYALKPTAQLAGGRK